jgi:hypothetical protein
MMDKNRAAYIYSKSCGMCACVCRFSLRFFFPSFPARFLIPPLFQSCSVITPFREIMIEVASGVSFGGSLLNRDPFVGIEMIVASFGSYIVQFE